MTDVFSKAKRSEVMSRIRGRGNKDTELRLVAILRANGITGWRRHQALPGHPDFIFRHERLAVFVDGCFWHGCPMHARAPRSNQAYWRAKIARNVARDRLVVKELGRRKWKVARIWEHELRGEKKIVRKLLKLLATVRKPFTALEPRQVLCKLSSTTSNEQDKKKSPATKSGRAQASRLHPGAAQGRAQRQKQSA